MQVWQLMIQVALELPSQHSLKIPDSFNVTGTKKLMFSHCRGHHGFSLHQQSLTWETKSGPNSGARSRTGFAGEGQVTV